MSGKRKGEEESQSSKKAKKEGEEDVVKKVFEKGKAPVDPECPIASKVSVFQKDGVIYDVMLNQTDISYSLKGHNKFIALQVLQDRAAPTKFYVWQRWGRVGNKGQKDLKGPISEDVAIHSFREKFSNKTMNDFSKIDQFKHVKGKYDLIRMDYSQEEKEEEKEIKKEEPKKVVESKLSQDLIELIKLIFNVKAMEAAMLEMNYDAKKSPLGKLTKGQIKAGYESLKKIEDLITAKKFGPKLVEACNEYYTKVPHDFGMRKPTEINDTKIVKKELELLQALGQIEIAFTTLNEKLPDDINPLDHHYLSLNCEISTIERDKEDFKIIEQYMKNTHGPTHKDYTLSIDKLYQVRRQEEFDRFNEKLHNKKLLWHGSRTTNFAGILKQGLRIAPPEAPVTGYMFGKGVYFADMSSKSANYAHASKSNPEGLLLLCEVALGDENELVAADYHADKLPSGKHSVKGKGKMEPDPSYTKSMFGDVVLPCGKPIQTGVVNPNGYTLQYNEFIVYDLNQVRIRYILKVDFKFK